EAYDRGRDVAWLAIERAPRSAAAHFWFATNTARWGQTKGVLRSLFLLSTVQKEIRTVLDLDAGFTAVYALAGYVYYEVPGLFGGDLDRAEQMFRKGLPQDPRFTGLRVGLGKTLIKRGRVAEAQRELQAVLDETAPTNPADWTFKDVGEARAILGTIRGRAEMRLVHACLERYASAEARALLPWVREPRLLDLGAGEGWVAEALRSRAPVWVCAVDIGPFGLVADPYVVYDGARLPFRDGAFDTTL